MSKKEPRGWKCHDLCHRKEGPLLNLYNHLRLSKLNPCSFLSSILLCFPQISSSPKKKKKDTLTLTTRMGPTTLVLYIDSISCWSTVSRVARELTPALLMSRFKPLFFSLDSTTDTAALILDRFSTSAMCKNSIWRGIRLNKEWGKRLFTIQLYQHSYVSVYLGTFIHTFHSNAATVCVHSPGLLICEMIKAYLYVGAAGPSPYVEQWQECWG